jgi:UTP-glucose-1-phosphate uridylyltransferase
MDTIETKYKVCILTAGVGDMAGGYTQHLNKGILPVNNKAVISYIIEKFPEDADIIIAVGHKKETVTDYLALAYPERKFTFVEVDKYTGPGSGPGYSLLACKQYLQSPFVFCTSDTIVLEDIPPPNENWIGIAPVHETEPYCTVKIKNNLVTQLDDKIKTDNKFAFIGLAGINDYNEFFSTLEQNKEPRNNELQMTDGFKGLLEKRLVPIGFTWFDTGTLKNYLDTNKHFSGGGDKFDFSKEDEFLYFVNGRVIKFFAEPEITGRRHYRATNGLRGLTPQIEKYQGNFYSYLMVPGQTVYSALNLKVLEDFLLWAKSNLWKRFNLTPEERQEFIAACFDFYHTKSKKRIQMYADKMSGVPEPRFINDVLVPSTAELLEKVDWKRLADGIPSNFHGDLQFDNVLLLRDPSTNANRFLLLDWRQDFANLKDVGDLYYDLAKLYGGLILSYPLIKEGMFSASISGDRMHYHFYARSDLQDAREQYEEYLQENGYDLKRIKILTALIFLNMSPLHNGPFDLMLHGLGRQMLSKGLKA